MDVQYGILARKQQPLCHYYNWHKAAAAILNKKVLLRMEY